MTNSFLFYVLFINDMKENHIKIKKLKFIYTSGSGIDNETEIIHNIHIFENYNKLRCEI